MKQASSGIVESMAKEGHLAILRNSVAKWNAWRQENRAVMPDLSGAHLSAAVLAGAQLSNAALDHAILNNADLRRACLSDADLRLADLSRADLRGGGPLSRDPNRHAT